MEVRNHFTHLALAGGLAAALALGGMAAAVPQSYADDSTGSATSSVTADATSATGSITINTNKNLSADNTTLSGYQIFKADVADKTVGTVTTKAVSNIEWASDAVQAAVVNSIKAVDSSYKDTTAQGAATWLSEHASGSGSSTVVDATDAFGKIASALRASGVKATTVTPGTAATLDAGYWLFVTNETTTDNVINQVGTAPIYAVVGGSAVTVNQKSNLPTVSKFIKNDATGSSWGKYADSEIGQSIDYKLTGTIADAYASYSTYYYSFYDTFDSGITLDTDSVTVKVQTPASGDAAQTETTVAATSYTKTYENNALTVTIGDLKTIKDENGNAITVAPNSVVTVYYTAHLNENAKVASAHNDNEVVLTYSNNPGTDSKGSTEQDQVRDYTYELMLMKVDASNSTALSGAKFTIQATGADEGAGLKYVQADGSLGDTAHEFTTGTDGGIYVSGLDAGTYTVVETQAPSGYNKAASFTFEIHPVYDTTSGDITNLAVSTNNGNVATASVPENSGVIALTVKDKAGMSLPLTGQNGVALLWVAGGVMVAAGATHLVRSRKKDKAQQ
jgi:hypothetical protein